MSNFISHLFEPSSAAAWKQKIQFELNGADYNNTLLTKTNEGITIKPFYHIDNFEKLRIPTPTKKFKICNKITITTEAVANSKAINAVNLGINSLKFVANKPFHLNTVFNQLLHKNIEFHFELNFLDNNFLNELAEWLKNELVFYNIDVIGNLAKTGNWHQSLTEDFKNVEKLILKNNASFILSVNANTYQNAGAHTIQQIAYALAHANEYLAYFGSDIATRIQFNFATGSNYFFEISKLRAFRYLYNLILGEYNTTAVAQIFTEPSLRNKTVYNYKVNTLRTATECFSSILGGANTVSNLPNNVLFHHSNELSENDAIAQLVNLKDENGVITTEITDNSYYIEAITKEMAEKALAIFKTIEKGGGFLKQLKEGTIQRKIAENAQKEQHQFNLGELIIVGANKYVNEKVKMENEIQHHSFSEKKSRKTLIIPITAKRLAETLEQKRLKNEA
jgi:methylmalonyl-CoA mutase